MTTTVIFLQAHVLKESQQEEKKEQEGMEGVIQKNDRVYRTVVLGLVVIVIVVAGGVIVLLLVAAACIHLLSL